MRLGLNPAILASRIVTLDHASSSTLSAPLSLIFFYRLMRCIWFLARALTTRTHHPWCSATYRTFYASCPRGQYNHLHMQPESPIRCRLVIPGYQRYLSPIRGTFISSFVLPPVISFLILASWVFLHFFFLCYPRFCLRILFLLRDYLIAPQYAHALQDEL